MTSKEWIQAVAPVMVVLVLAELIIGWVAWRASETADAMSCISSFAGKLEVVNWQDEQVHLALGPEWRVLTKPEISLLTRRVRPGDCWHWDETNPQDRWQRPLRISAKIGENGGYQFLLESAGIDGLFSTDDDISIVTKNRTPVNRSPIR